MTYLCMDATLFSRFLCENNYGTLVYAKHRELCKGSQFAQCKGFQMPVCRRFLVQSDQVNCVLATLQFRWPNKIV